MRYRVADRIKNSIEFILGMGTLAYIKNTEISNQFISGNVPDLIYPITNYAACRAFLNFKKPNLFLALGIATLGTAVEIMQKYPSVIETIDPLNLLSRTYESMDIPMYFLGALVVWSIDKLTFNEKEANLENKLAPNPHH